MLQIPKLIKSYGKIGILNIKNVKISQGLYWIQGTNGAGKSTFLKAIAGIISFEGKCSIDGINIIDEPVEYRRKISYCEAEPEFPDFLTQKDLLHFAGKARGASKEQISNLQEKLDTKLYENQPLKTYSSGMLKKMGLLLAFLGKPSIILLDEPFTAIDYQSVDNLIDLIKTYRDSHSTTFLVTSHIDSGHYHLAFDKVFKIEDKTLSEIGE